MAAKEFTSVVVSNQMITPTVFLLKFKPAEPISFSAGQFLSMVVPGAGPGGKDLRRAYSIASPPERDYIELCIKIVENGPGTTYLKNLKAGDQVRCFAPYGSFVYKPKENNSNHHVCFIATGTGISPFRSMLFSKVFQNSPPKSSYCLFGVSNENEVLFEKEFSQAPHLTKWVAAVSRPSTAWSGFKGRVTHYIRSLDAHFPWKNVDFYLCGNGAMIDEIKKILMEEKGVDKTQIHQEIYYKPKPGAEK